MDGKKNHLQIWTHFFDFRRITTRNKRSVYAITTNGEDDSVRMTHCLCPPANEYKKEEEAIQQSQQE